NIFLNKLGLASLYPVWSRMAAKHDNGIKLMRDGIAKSATNSQRPRNMADCRVRPPACAFAEERTITDVMGSPPRNPLAILPTPCATNSLLVGVTRLKG